MAPNANTHVGRKQSLPVHSFGSVPGSRDANFCSAEADMFQTSDPGGLGVATRKMDDKDRLGKSLNGASFDESKLATPIRSSSARSSTMPITDARQPRGRPSATLPALIDTRPSALSYRDIAKCTPPPSPSLRPITPTTTTTSTMNTKAWLPPSQRPKLDTDTSKQFPPLLSPAKLTSTTGPVPSSKSYAKCFDPSSAQAAAPVSESPVNNYASPIPPPPVQGQAKVITLSITPSKQQQQQQCAVNAATSSTSPQASTRPGPGRTPPSPTTPSKLPRKKSSAPTPTNIGCLRLPSDQQRGRDRSASVSSISSTPSLVSTVATSVATTTRPTYESEEWYAELVTFARGMSKKSRRAWEKILRSDPKDTSKMKWAEFDMALKAVGFESKTRGGSDLEYTPGRFGENNIYTKAWKWKRI
ncbi:hypothetical protein FRC07_007233 [Ceratobasidium sp. 392]|nr:hypothetical protein FRC07_007233 [Ceratobasidium sp. 392]